MNLVSFKVENLWIPVYFHWCLFIGLWRFLFCSWVTFHKFSKKLLSFQFHWHKFDYSFNLWSLKSLICTIAYSLFPKIVFSWPLLTCSHCTHSFYPPKNQFLILLILSAVCFPQNSLIPSVCYGFLISSLLFPFFLFLKLNTS